MRDECSSGIRSEAEEENTDHRPPRPSPRPKPGLGSGPAHLSLSTTSSLSSACSNPSQARLVQSSRQQRDETRVGDIRDSSTPPAPPPRTSSSATSGSGDNGAGSGQELGKTPVVSSGGGQGPESRQQRDETRVEGGGKTTCMQCYLSGHSDGSLDSSVDPSISQSEAVIGSLDQSEASSVSGLTLSVGQAADNGDRFEPGDEKTDCTKKNSF